MIMFIHFICIYYMKFIANVLIMKAKVGFFISKLRFLHTNMLF